MGYFIFYVVTDTDKVILLVSSLLVFRISCLDVFCKKDVLENFANFTKNNLCWNLSRKDSNTGFFRWILLNLSQQLFCRTLRIAASEFWINFIQLIATKMWLHKSGVPKRTTAIPIRSKFNTKLSLISHVKIAKDNQTKPNFNQFLANVPILHHLEIPENQRIFGIFREYKMETLVRNGLPSRHSHVQSH